MLDMTKLQEKIDKVVDNTGISIGKYEDRSTWKIHYKGEPTKQQLAAAAAIIQEQRVLTEEQDQETVRALGFLQATDWMIVRHLEELAVGKVTSLTDDEFKILNARRDAGRASVDKG